MKQRRFEPQTNKYSCKCGHIVCIPVFREKVLCKWCGEYVFTNKRKEFEYRLLEQKRKVTA